MTSGPSARRPDIFVVVLDCLRASDFLGGAASPEDLPVSREIARSSWSFPRAVAPSSWTMPSHVSLLSGLYPWEHGVHGRSSLQVPADLPMLPSLLGKQGYRSLLLSANPMLGPWSGLSGSFDVAAWAARWEPFLRWPSTHVPASRMSERGVRGGVRSPPTLGKPNALRSGLVSGAHVLYRHVGWLRGANRALGRIAGERDPDGSGPSRWIEPTLERWLSAVPRERPVFALINYMETHEPYLDTVDGDLGAPNTCQDQLEYLGGRRTLSEEDRRRLRGVYRGSVRRADRRLGLLKSVLERSGRWENCSLVVTSDHGQALGESGHFFHFLYVDPTLVRVPLLVRPPGGDPSHGPAATSSWVSLIDLAPTLLQFAGCALPPLPSALPLAPFRGGERPAPVLSSADGLVWRDRRRKLPDPYRTELDRVRVVAYQGERSLRVEEGRGVVGLFDVRSDPEEQRELAAEGGSVEPALRAEAERALGRMLRGTATDPGDHRLRSWGYT